MKTPFRFAVDHAHFVEAIQGGLSKLGGGVLRLEHVTTSLLVT